MNGRSFDGGFLGRDSVNFHNTVYVCPQSGTEVLSCWLSLVQSVDDDGGCKEWIDITVQIANSNYDL